MDKIVFGFNRFIFQFPLAMLCFIILGVFAVPPQAIAQTAEPLVAIHVSELTNALDPTADSWHYYVAYESLEEALRSDGTPFIEISDSDIAAGNLSNPDGSPKYPILISLGAAAIDDNEITPLSNYVNAGGFLFAGSNSFTLNPDGSSRSDFALAGAMGLDAALNNGYAGWSLNYQFTKQASHQLTSQIPEGTLLWDDPLTSDEIPSGISPTHVINSNQYAFQVTAGNATVLATGTVGPLLTVNSYGSGQIIYDGRLQPLIGHGGYDVGMYSYLIYRNAIEWAFGSFSLPIVKVSPWRYQYDAAVIFRHDFENNQASIIAIPSSAQYENSLGATGEYYFCTGALRQDMGNDPTTIAGLRSAVSQYGATIGSHNGGLPNPVNLSLTELDFDYWHWGPDEVLDITPPGYANGQAYASASILASFQDIEGWLSGLDNGRTGCGAAVNCPRIWGGPYFNSTREVSREIIDQLGAITMGEQKIGPFPHRSLSYDTPGKYYSSITLPVSEWFIGNTLEQTIAYDDGTTDYAVSDIDSAVDFYYGLGALINFYGHQPSNALAVTQENVTHSLSKPNIWSTNSVGVHDWWLLRSNVVAAPTITSTGNIYTVTASVSGATDLGTSVEIVLPQNQSNMSVFLDGALADPSAYRFTNYGSLKVQVGNLVSSIQVQYTIMQSGMQSATVTLGNLTQTYDGTQKSATATTSPPGLTVNFTYNGSSTAPTNAGSYYVLAAINDSTYQGVATGTLTINKANQSALTVTSLPGSASYGQTGITAVASGGSGTGTVSFSAGSSTACTVDSSTGAVSITSGSGTCLISDTKAADSNYNSATSDAVTVSINKAAATVTLTPASLTQTYTGSALTPAATTNPSGLNVTWTGAPQTAAGTYPVTATVNDANYQGTASGSFVINKAAATVTLTPASLTQTYTGSALTPAATTNPSGLNVTWTGAPQTAAGTYPVTATVNDPNYQGTASGSFVINKAAATVTLTPASLTQTYTGSALTPAATTNPSGLNVTWTGAPQTAAGTYPVTATVNDPNYQGTASGSFVINKAAATVTLTPASLTQTYTGSALTPAASTNPSGLSVTWTGAPQTAAGTYPVTATVNDANYQGTASGSFVINKAAATVTLTPASLTQTYTGSALTPAATTNPSGLNVTWTGAPQTAAGTYPVTATVNDPNYQGTASGSFVINKAAATVTLTPASLTQTYTGSALTPAATTNPSGLNVTWTGAPQTAAGTYPVTATVNDANYQGTASGSFVINKAAATVTLTPASLTQTYTGSALTPAASTNPSGLNVTWTGAPQTAAGTYPVTATVNDPNYQGTASGSFVINKAAATVTLTPASLTQTYTGSALTPAATTNPSGLNVTWTGAPQTAAGTYPVTATVNDANYQGTASGSFVINKAAATVTLTPASLTQTYTGSALTPAATTNPSGLNVTWTGAPQTAAGTYPVTATVNDPNYQGTASGSFVINKAAATVTLTPASLTQTYTGSALTPAATTNPSGLNVTWTGAPQTAAGTYPVTATVNDANYQGTASGSFVINKAAATVTLGNMAQIYTGSPLSPSATTTPPNLSVNWSGIPDTAAGTYPVTAAINDSNYQGTATGIFVIRTHPVPIASSISPTSRTARGTAFSLTVKGSGFVKGFEVYWNGEPRKTTFVSNTQLTAAITATDIAVSGTANVTVFDPTPGGGTSNAETLTIDNPMPKTTSMSPTTAYAGRAGFTLTVNGTGFNSNSVVNWNGDSATTTFVSSTRLTAEIPETEIASAGTAQVTVYNPAPDGGTSTPPLSFTIKYAPLPVITSISPTSQPAGGAAFTLIVKGSNFVPDSVVQWNGNSRTTTFVSSTQLKAAIPATDIATAGTASVTVFTSSPGGGATYPLPFIFNNPAPKTTSMSPATAYAGRPAFTLTVNGAGFNSDSQLQWNGTSLTTTYVSATQLTATIPLEDIATAGTAKVTVFNPAPGGGTSTARTFTVKIASAPSISSISPSSLTPGGSPFMLTVNGSGFVPDSVVQWNGDSTSITTTFVSSTQLKATIPATDITTVGTASVTVSTPSPGGSTSNTKTLTINAATSTKVSDDFNRFTINNPLPTTTALSPATASAGGPAFTLTVNGTGFVNGSVVKWNGVNHTTTFVSATQLTASITAANIAKAGPASVTVFNPTPGGGTSNVQAFTIGNPPVPVISSITPASQMAGGVGFTLTVNGSGFNSNSVVEWNGGDRTTTFVSATKLTAAILVDDIATAGTAQVKVFTPDPTYGGTSNAKTLTINNPVPTNTSLSTISTIAGGSDFVLTVTGSNFNSSSVVLWNTTSLTPTNVSAAQLTVLIPAADIAKAGTATVKVFNPVPGGGTSSAKTFTINNPVPTTTGLSLAAASAGGPAFPLTVYGTGFVNGSVVKWNGVNHTTTFVSATQLTASITAANIAKAGTALVTVFNPTPGGGTSNDQTFTINAATSTTVSDDFNRANRNPIGGNWTTVPGAKNLQLLNDAVSTTAANQYGINAADAYWNANSFGPDQCSQATLLVAGASIWSGPIVRASATSLSYYALNANGTTSYQLYKVLNGVETVMGADLAQVPQSGDVLKISAVGSTISAYVNGVLIGSRTDSGVTGGSPGVECSQTSDATPTIGNWSGWSVTGS